MKGSKVSREDQFLIINKHRNKCS
uniref:Uncharacterized protein n=1 Tax=Anguilla anguilla TaxID=7936 RepID=A0A0E9SDM9_ANGAN